MAARSRSAIELNSVSQLSSMSTALPRSAMLLTCSLALELLHYTQHSLLTPFRRTLSPSSPRSPRANVSTSSEFDSSSPPLSSMSNPSVIPYDPPARTRPRSKSRLSSALEAAEHLAEDVAIVGAAASKATRVASKFGRDYEDAYPDAWLSQPVGGRGEDGGRRGRGREARSEMEDEGGAGSSRRMPRDEEAHEGGLDSSRERRNWPRSEVSSRR